MSVNPALPVVCLHSSGAGGKQWRRFVADLGEPCHTPDLYGHGEREGWPAGAPSRLEVEAEGVLAALDLPPDQPFDLIGHSYGGATSLQLALLHPQRVRSLTLYEPVAFGVLPALGDDEPGWIEIQSVAGALADAVKRGDILDGARGFCGYWQNRDIWPELDDAQRARLAEPMPTVSRHFEALFAARWTDAELSRLQMPVQLICGSATRLSAMHVSQTLVKRLPNARLDWLEGGVHMSPIGEAARVNPMLLASIARARQSSVST